MGQPRLTWGQVKRYFTDRGYEIHDDGGDKIIVAPKDGKPRARQTVRLGHTSTRNAGTEILKCYESKLRHAFGINPKDIHDSR